MQMGENEREQRTAYGEPWKVGESTPNRIDTPNGAVCVNWSNHEGGSSNRNPYALAEATAARIAACVNACRGLSDHYLESRQDGDLRDELISYNRLAVEHARLAEAAKAVQNQLDYLQGLWGKEAITDRLANDLRAALDPPAPEGER